MPYIDLPRGSGYGGAGLEEERALQKELHENPLADGNEPSNDLYRLPAERAVESEAGGS